MKNTYMTKHDKYTMLLNYMYYTCAIGKYPSNNDFYNYVLIHDLKINPLNMEHTLRRMLFNVVIFCTNNRRRIVDEYMVLKYANAHNFKINTKVTF